MDENGTNTVQPGNTTQAVPGSVISPQSSVPAPAPSVIPEQPQENVTQQQPAPAQPAVESESPVQLQDAQADQAAYQSQMEPTYYDSDGFSWSGPEFVSHDKSSNWYMLFLAGALILAGAIYFLTRDIISSATVAIAIALFAFYGMRKPKDTNYVVGETGLSVGQKSFSYGDFSSFTVNKEGAYLSVTLLPLKRFSPPVGLYYQGQDEEEDQLVNFLSERLPLEQHKLDLVDNVMQRIRF